MKKGRMKKAVSGFLAALTLLSTVLSPVYASEVQPKEPKPPLYEEVKNQLDTDEVVKAEDLELDYGSTFDVKLDFTKIEIPDKEKVKVTFEEAKNETGEEFSTEKADTYKAVYYVEPTKTDHPKYQISRKLIVKEPQQEEIQTVGTTDIVQNDAEISEEESDSDGETQPGEETDSDIDSAEDQEPSDTQETPVTEVPDVEVEPSADQEMEETPVEPEEPKASEEIEQLLPETEENEEIEEKTDDGSYKVEIVKGDEYNITLNHEDGKYAPGEIVEFSADIAGLPAVETTMVEANKDESNADLMYSEVTYNEETGTYSFVMPEDDITLGVSTDQAEGGIMLTASGDPWDDATEIEANKYYYYSDGQLHPFDSIMGQGGNDSYKYVRYKVDGKTYTVNAYCMQHSMQSPPSGTTYTKMVELSEGGDDRYLRKALFYGYGGPGWGHTFNGYNIKSIMQNAGCSSEMRAMQHYLVDYLYDGESGFGGALSTTAKNMLKDIKAALKNMPDPTTMELLPGLSTTASSRNTETFTWKANSAFTITIQLENGVSLVNETTGKTGTGNVTVKGGEKFHLTATTDNISNLKGSYKITSNYPLDFHAMLLKLQSSQDIGFGYYTDSSDISLKVKWPDDAGIEIIKKDNKTGKNLAGAVYGVYSNEACTQLITQMPATDANGYSKVTITKSQDTVYLKEITSPTGYVIDTKAYGVKLVAGSSTSHTFGDDYVTASIHLVKKDKETGNVTQGDAKFEGAVYGLYAREDIVHPDGKSGVLYKKNTQVSTMNVDAAGNAQVDNLFLGKYYVKEITPPAGYLLDEEEHDVECSYEGGKVKNIERTIESSEQVNKQPFQVIKAANNGKTDADLLKGAGFSAYLASSLKEKEDGSYDFTGAQPVVITEDGKTEMFTDAKGYAKSIPLPYGKYVVRETTTPHNYNPVDDFIVIISENYPDEPQTWRVLLDDEFKAKLKIIKKDDETKKSVLVAGTEFKIYDMDHKKYVEQVTSYPTVQKHTSYFTDSDGYLILPENLKIGHYRVEEVTAPDGYTINKNYVEISVDANTAYLQESETGDTIIEVEYENHPVKGELSIYKKGEVLADYDGKDFQYEEKYLSGAEFEVYAAENIFTADYQKDAEGNRILEYAEGTLVTTVTTDGSGLAVVKNLPLGKYLVKEANAPTGFVLNSVPQETSMEYADQNTAVIKESVTFDDTRQKVEINVEKQDAENGATVAGAGFGIYNAEDLVNDEGKIIVKADTLLQEMTSDENGNVTFTLDLPLGKYYVKELKAPAGFVSSDEILNFDASYQGQNTTVVSLKEVKKNQPTTVEITKSDITTGTELDGANMRVLDKEGNVIDEWTSVKDQPHVIKRLVVGEEYTLREEIAPYGYLKATDVKFRLEDTAEIQKVEMKDEVPMGLLIINKKGEFLDKVTLLDSAKGTVEHLFEYISGNLTEVTFEVYAAEDIKAADGVSADYYKADDLVGTITTDDKGIAQLENLPAGKYYVKETATAHGYVLDSEIRYVDLSYRDQDTPVITFDEDWQNARQKVIVQVLKKEKNVDRVLAGGVFGLYAAEDIRSVSGKVLLKADEIIEQKTTDENGQISFLADLPVDGKYYVKELKAPDGFVTTEEKQEFTFEYKGENVTEVPYEFTCENEPTTVELTKSDLTTGEELPGAHLKVTDKDGNIVDEWISEKNPHVIKELTVGKKYTLTETKPADGFVTAESIEFTVENTAEIQRHEMKDDITKVQISKTDITGDKEIPGAKLIILDKNDQVVESWISTDKPHYVEKLPVGNYTLREEQAPKGFVLTSDVTFEVKDTGEVQTVTMKNDTVKGKIIINKTDADTEKPLKGVEYEIQNSKGKVLEKLVTDAAGHAESSLYEIASYKNGKFNKAIKYYLVETKALDGYELDQTKYEIVFEYADQYTPVIEVKKALTNKETQPGESDEAQPHDSGSTERTSPKTGDTTNLLLPVILLFAAAGTMAGILIRRKKLNTEKKNND